MNAIFNDLCVCSHLMLSAVIFMIGLAGLVFNRGNAIVSIMSLELMFVAPIINFVFFSAHRNDVVGQIFLFSLLVLWQEKRL